MNPTTNFSRSRLNTRAVLSPVKPRLGLGAIARFRPAISATNGSPTNRLVPSFPTAIPPSRWFNPHLLDKLQAPLTRYHD